MRQLGSGWRGDGGLFLPGVGLSSAYCHLQPIVFQIHYGMYAYLCVHSSQDASQSLLQNLMREFEHNNTSKVLINHIILTDWINLLGTLDCLEGKARFTLLLSFLPDILLYSSAEHSNKSLTFKSKTVSRIKTNKKVTQKHDGPKT